MGPFSFILNINLDAQVLRCAIGSPSTGLLLFVQKRTANRSDYTEIPCDKELRLLHSGDYLQ